MAHGNGYDIPIYSRPARQFHWLIVFLLLLQVPIGLYMTYRGYEMEGVNDKGEVVKGVWDGVTDTLYSSHKTIGLTILLLVVLRLLYRLTKGAPPSDPSVPPALTASSQLVHGLLYLALIAVPVIGYLGISYRQLSRSLRRAAAARDDRGQEVLGTSLGVARACGLHASGARGAAHPRRDLPQDRAQGPRRRAHAAEARRIA